MQGNSFRVIKKEIKPGRGTKDIDFAIMISLIQEYETISEELAKYGFDNVKDSSCWFYSSDYNIVIDLLPFGEIEEEFTVSFNERYTDLHVLWFSEVLQDFEKVEIEEKYVQVPPLGGMVILKLIAWSDRPEVRNSDLYDILKIIEDYFYLKFDGIVEHHNDVFPEKRRNRSN